MAEALNQTEIQRAGAPIPSTIDAKGQWQRVATPVVQRWKALSSGQRKRFVFLVLLVMAAISAFVWYGTRTEWRPLYMGMESKDMQAVSQELSAAGIQAKISADGSSIEVPAEMIDKARMDVAAKGMPQSGRMGFELFDKPNWVGSEFDEKVNYQRALEGELEHTIETLGAVRSARVHLSMAKESLFTSEQQPAKATVVLKLKRESLPEGGADSIRNLVSGAVEGLQPSQVTLVDADGRANLSEPNQSAQGANASKLMEQQLVSMLEPVAGGGNVRAAVHVEYEQGTEEKTDEVYDPSQSATISMERTEQVQGSPPKPASGVPGTQSNTPAAKDEAKEALPVFPQSTASNNAKRESASYAVTKHLVHTEEGAGRVKRLTVAVLVNDRLELQGAGKSAQKVWHQRSGEEMRRLEQIVQAASGYDVKRGDVLTLANVSFWQNGEPMEKVGPAQQVLEEGKTLLQRPALVRAAVLILLGVVLIFTVLRPFMRAVIGGVEAPVGSSALALPGGQPFESSMMPGTEPPHSLPLRHSYGMAREENRIFHELADQIRLEPRQSTRLLEHWLSSHAAEEE